MCVCIGWGAQDAVTKIRFVPNSALILTGSVDSKLRLWDARNGQCVKLLRGHVDALLDFDLTRYATLARSVCDWLGGLC